jgi:predicted dehydrogenase
MSRPKLIHVGLGRWGFDWARDVFPQAPEVEVVAYVDRDLAALSRAQAKLGAPADICFTDLAAAFQVVDADAVVVCLPIEHHVPVTVQALEAGKHVIVEKPFARSPAEALPVVLLAERLGLTLMVSQNYRRYPAAVMAANIVRSGFLGQLCSIKIDFRRLAPSEGYKYWGLPDPLLVDMAVHHYDLMRMVIGEEPFELSCRTWNPPGSPFEGDPSGAIVASFPSGVTVSYRGSWLDHGPQTAWAGEWQMDFENGVVFWTSRGDPPDRSARDQLTVQRSRSPAQEPPLIKGPHDRPAVLGAFAEAIRTGREREYFSSGRDNLGTLEIIEATLKSSAMKGASVTLANVAASSSTNE